MRIRQGLKMFGNTNAALRRIHGFQALRDRPGGPGPGQGHRLDSLQERLHRPPQLRPELDLPGDRALRRLGGEAGVKDQQVGKLYRLTHGSKVAKGYLESSARHLDEHCVADLADASWKIRTRDPATFATAKVGEPAPDFTLTDTDGRKLSDFRGKKAVALINKQGNLLG